MLDHTKKVKYLTDPDTFTSALMCIVVDELGTSSFEWEPEVIEDELKHRLGIKKIPRINLDKISAAITIMTSTAFYKDPTVFIHIVRALNNRAPGFDTFPEIYSDDILWAIYEAYLLDEPESLRKSYSEDICLAIGAILLQEGLYSKPKELSFAKYPESVLAEKADFTVIESMSKDVASIGGRRYKEMMEDFEASKETLREQLSDLTGKKKAA